MRSEIAIAQALDGLDYLVFVAIIFFTICAVIYGYRHRKINDGTSQSFIDYMIMARGLTLPLFVATLVATWYGGIFGVTQIAFKQGIFNFLTQGVFWYFSYLIFAFFLAKHVRNFGAITLPELVGKMFGPKSSYVAGVFNLFNVLPIAYSISLGLFIQLLTNLEFFPSCVIGTVLVACYSLLGGFRAVVYSDLIQFVVMCTAVFMVLLFSVSKFGGLGFLSSQLEPHYFSLTGGTSLSTTLVWGFIALSTLVDPNFYHRCFAANSLRTAKRGIIVATMIWCVFDLCTTFGGMYAAALIPHAQPETAYLTYALQLLPSGLRGFFLAGILATILSTLDSYLFIASNTLAYDLAPKLFRSKVWANKVGILLVGILAIALAQTFEGQIKDVWKTLGSYSAGCLLIPVLLGYLKWPPISDRQFLFSCLLAAFAISIWRFQLVPSAISGIESLYVGMFFSIVSIIGWHGLRSVVLTLNLKH